MAARGTKRTLASSSSTDYSDKRTRLGKYYTCIPQFLGVSTSTPQCLEYDEKSDEKIPVELYDSQELCQEQCNRKIVPRDLLPNIASFLDQKSLTGLRSTTQKIAKAEDIEKQRIYYQIYIELIDALKKSDPGVKRERLINTFCSMVKRNNGILFSRHITKYLLDVLEYINYLMNTLMNMLVCIAENKEWEVNDSDKYRIILGDIGFIYKIEPSHRIKLAKIINSHLFKIVDPELNLKALMGTVEYNPIIVEKLLSYLPNKYINELFDDYNTSLHEDALGSNDIIKNYYAVIARNPTKIDITRTALQDLIDLFQKTIKEYILSTNELDMARAIIEFLEDIKKSWKGV